MQKNGPVGKLLSCYKDQQITEELLFQWFLHFKQFSEPSKDKPVFLVLNSHASHIALRIYNYRRHNGIIFLH
jgi:hypothetical protein